MLAKNISEDHSRHNIKRERLKPELTVTENFKERVEICQNANSNPCSDRSVFLLLKMTKLFSKMTKMTLVSEMTSFRRL